MNAVGECFFYKRRMSVCRNTEEYSIQILVPVHFFRILVPSASVFSCSFFCHITIAAIADGLQFNRKEMKCRKNVPIRMRTNADDSSAYTPLIFALIHDSHLLLSGFSRSLFFLNEFPKCHYADLMVFRC